MPAPKRCRKSRGRWSDRRRSSICCSVARPDAWSEAYGRTLGMRPGNDAEGCLQDGHWADGLLGYFPSYTLGDVFAAQLFAQAELELGDIDEQLARGDCALLVR